MTNSGERRWHWRFFEGTVSISASMWLAIALNQCSACAGWPLLGFLNRLATNETGIIIVATALLFPTASVLYGGVLMFFAAKDTVERWSRAKDEKAMAKGREEGRTEGRKEGRDAGRGEIVALLKEHNVQLPPEVISKLNGAGNSE